MTYGALEARTRFASLVQMTRRASATCGGHMTNTWPLEDNLDNNRDSLFLTLSSIMSLCPGSTLLRSRMDCNISAG